MTSRSGLVWFCATWLVTACGGGPTADDGRLHVTLKLLDESGASVNNGQIEGSGFKRDTDGTGTVSLDLSGPDVLLARGDGVVPEPVIVGFGDQGRTLAVTLWSTKSGSRRVMHFGGDVMFGRRYSEPSAGEPLLMPGDIEASAAFVVAPLARAFSAADYSVVNLETVVSDLPADAAYPGKRFLLNSPTEALAGLDALGVDLVTLANNHTRDWLESGLEATLAALDARGIPHTGAGLDAAAATEFHTATLDGLRVTSLAYTSVNGSFVNDNYPGDTESTPEDVSEEEAWIWEQRAFALRQDGFVIESGSYRIGEVWRRYSDIELTLSEEQRSTAWQTITETYPELQDWVARRGHGGAAYFVSKQAKSQIAAAKTNADLVIVHLHAGFQFQNVASETVVEMAHGAIDAGADLVIGHHPHVLQGVEFYQGKLIAYSLGNFVFDQDFLSTFSSGFLRVLWEDNRLLEARFLPVEIANYRPHIVADRAAERVFARLWESSVTPARSARLGGGVFPIRSDQVPEDEMVQVTRQSGSVRFGLGIRPVREKVSANGTSLALPRDRLTKVVRGEGFSLGRELFGWGDFEDVLADGILAFGQNFVLDHADKTIIQRDAPEGRAYLRLRRDAKKNATLWLRPVARVALARHRLYEATSEEAVAVDPAAKYSLMARLRGSGDAHPSFRIDTFLFDDANPTEDPGSERLEPVVVPINQVTSQFERIEFPVELPTTATGVVPNMVMIYVGLDPPEAGEATLDVDEINWVEWRDAGALPPSYGAYDYVKREDSGADLTVEWISSTPSAGD